MCSRFWIFEQRLGDFAKVLLKSSRYCVDLQDVRPWFNIAHSSLQAKTLKVK